MIIMKYLDDLYDELTKKEAELEKIEKEIKDINDFQNKNNIESITDKNIADKE